MDMSLSKLWELVMNREAWHPVACSPWVLQRVRHDWVPEMNWTESRQYKTRSRNSHLWFLLSEMDSRCRNVSKLELQGLLIEEYAPQCKRDVVKFSPSMPREHLWCETEKIYNYSSMGLKYECKLHSIKGASKAAVMILWLAYNKNSNKNGRPPQK